MSVISQSRPLGLDFGEFALLATFWSFSTGIFIWSFWYSGFTGLFPRIFAVAVLTGSTLLLIRNYLPASAQELITTSSNIQDLSEEVGEGDVAESLAEAEEETEIELDEPDRPLSDTQFVSAAVVGYFGLSYLVGMLWASPVFGLVYALWYGKSWQYTAIILVVTFAIPYAFYDVLNLQIIDGYIHEQLGLT